MSKKINTTISATTKEQAIKIEQLIKLEVLTISRKLFEQLQQPRIQYADRDHSLIRWFRSFAKATAFTLALWVAAALGFVLAAKFGTIVASALITAAFIAIFTYLYIRG